MTELGISFGLQYKTFPTLAIGQAEEPSSSQWAQLGSEAAIGTVFGYMVGNIVKQASKKTIFYCVMTGAMIVGGMACKRWLTFNWKQIDADLQ